MLLTAAFWQLFFLTLCTLNSMINMNNHTAEGENGNSKGEVRLDGENR